MYTSSGEGVVHSIKSGNIYSTLKTPYFYLRLILNSLATVYPAYMVKALILLDTYVDFLII